MQTFTVPLKPPPVLPRSWLQTISKTLPVVTLSQAALLGHVVPILLTAAGLFHDRRDVWFSQLLTCFMYLEAFALAGCIIMEAFARIFGRRIQTPGNHPALLMQELWETTRCMYTVATFAVWPVTQLVLGRPCGFKFTLEDTGLSFPAYLVFTLAGILWSDCWNYWKHRALHSKNLFAFHKSHHSFHDPSSFACFAIHPVEAVLTFWPILVLVHPMCAVWLPFHAPIIIGLAALNFYLHCGYTIGILEAALPLLYINTSGFHNAHHEYTYTHFGEILTLWDHVLNTDPLRAKNAHGRDRANQTVVIAKKTE